MQDMDLWDDTFVDDLMVLGNRMLIVGGGKMGGAILEGFVDMVEAGCITVVEVDQARRSTLQERYPDIATVSRIDQIEDHTYGALDWIILAVKPQMMGEVLDEINRVGCQSVVISVAVGIAIDHLQKALPLASVMRIMPNLPVMVGEGTVLLAPGSSATGEQVEAVAEACCELGEVTIIDEEDIDICAAISGSGPAYFALIIDALEVAGTSAGLAPELARALAVNTMLGTAYMIDATGEDPLEIAQAVQSPGGTTERAVAVLGQHGLSEMFGQAVNAAIERARRLREGA
jgi:pyrroline-5-carboxylate reductase